eukprot:scaffold20608_cov140-Isochrysis_galbana.AAC.4
MLEYYKIKYMMRWQTSATGHYIPYWSLALPPIPPIPAPYTYYLSPIYTRYTALWGAGAGPKCTTKAPGDGRGRP